MTHALDVVVSLIAGLFGLVVAAIAAVEGVLRGALDQLHVPHQTQSPILIVVGLLLAVAALRLFGRLLGILVGIVVVLFVLHILDPGSAHLFDRPR